MIALLTGVISEAMFQKNQVKMEEERQDREASRALLLESCQALFDEFLQGGADEVTRGQVREMFPHIRVLFDDFNVRYTNHELEDVIRLMDTDGSGSVNKSEFCRCLLHIAENSEDLRPMLMMELHYDSMSFLKTNLAQFRGHMDQASGEQRANRQSVEMSVERLLSQIDAHHQSSRQREEALDARMERIEVEVRHVSAAVASMAADARSAKGRSAHES